MKHTWRLLLGALCTAIAIGAFVAGPATAALSDGAVHTTKVNLLDDDDVKVCIGHECDELEDTEKVELSVYAWFLNNSLSKPDKPRLVEVACPIGAAQGTAVAAVAQEDGWLYILAVASGRDSFADVDVPNTAIVGPSLRWVHGGEAVLVSACADTKDRHHLGDRDRKHRDDRTHDARDGKDRDDKHRSRKGERRDDHKDKDERKSKRH